MFPVNKKDSLQLILVLHLLAEKCFNECFLPLSAGVYKKELEQTRRELNSLVDEFYHSLRQIYEVMQNKHRQQLLDLVRRKRIQEKG